MLNLRIEKENKKRGIGAILSILLLVVLLPLMLFIVIDIPYYNQYHKKIKDIVDNTAASAVTRLNEDLLADGIIRLDYDAARTYMFKSLQTWFDLEPILYDSNVENVYIMHRNDIQSNGTATRSLLDADPLVIEIKKGMNTVTNPEVLESTRIEFFVHTDTSKYTYEFTNGEKITVSTPTVGIYIETTQHGVIFHWPMKVKKFGISEVSLDPYVPDF